MLTSSARTYQTNSKALNTLPFITFDNACGYNTCGLYGACVDSVLGW